MTNAEFLAKYPTDEAQIDYYTDLAIDIFKEFEIDGAFSKKGVYTNVKIWYENKKKQMELFRKHPCWNEEAKAIIFTHTEVREANYGMARDNVAKLYGYIEKKRGGISPGFIAAIYHTLSETKKESPQISEEFLTRYEEYTHSDKLSDKLNSMLKVGTKITRVVMQYCKDIGINEAEEFNKFYAKFADSMSRLETKKTIVISLHFCDFMTMSNGNSWMTCHYINSHNIFHESGSNSGSYKQGCLSYALDEFSFLLYTLPDPCGDKAYYRIQKINRMCCQYKNGILVTGKCYPDNSDSSINLYKETAQQVIADAESASNSWTSTNNINIIDGFTKTERHASHYADYKKSSQKPTLSIRRNSLFEIEDSILIGHQAYCLWCGNKLDSDESSWLQCEKHRKEMICSHCGQIITDPDNVHINDSECFCIECSFYCDYHKQYEPISKARTMINKNQLVCQEAISHMTLCKCGTYISKNQKICPTCGEHYEIKISVVPSTEYEIGDYVLIVDEDAIGKCKHGYNDQMQDYYANRIVKIININSWLNDAYNISSLDDENWAWSSNCFVGIVQGVDDSMIGQTLPEEAIR